MQVKWSRSLVGVTALAAVVVVLAGCDSGGASTRSNASPGLVAAPSAGPARSSTPTSSVRQAANKPPASPSPHTVNLGGAQLTLPGGWVAGFEEPKGHSANMLDTWCLSPTPLPSPVYLDQDCAAHFSRVPAEILVSVDTVGGIISNPEFCLPGNYTTDALVDYRHTMLGNRPADYRRWEFACKDGRHASIEQYVADNAPGYILGGDADPATHAALTSIAKSAVLPAISGPLRLSDLGIVRTMAPLAGGGYHLTLDRVVQSTNGLINNNPATYAYDVPATSTPGQQPPRVGALINVFTNGTKVTSYQLPPA